MKNVIEQNMEILSKSLFRFIDAIEPQEVNYEFVGADLGAQEEFFQDKEERVYLIKPEFDDTVRPNRDKRELFFIFGVYGLEEIKYLMEQANENTAFVIIEPEKSFFFHALRTKDMRFLHRNNVALVVKSLTDIPTVVDYIFQTQLIYLVKNIRFYTTFFYRHYNSAILKQLISLISTGLTYKLFSIGNSIEDSLIGLQQNMHNIRYLPKSKDFSKLKGAFSGKPAILIAAGPSLDKNVHLLRLAHGRCIIIAVDTICRKLLKNGITPDFMVSMERLEQVYRYFYKDQDIPSSVTLVGPLLLTPQIYENFKGRYIIPMRHLVGEYMWLAEKILNLSDEFFLSIGLSCAHISLGIANHLGCTPLVLVGQDLAFGEDYTHTHSQDTIYSDGIDADPFEPISEVDGYYGGKVQSRKLWIDFRKWFELEIASKGIYVINATEGGARIANTEQMPLEEVIKKYCSGDAIDIGGTLDNLPDYPFDKEKFMYNLDIEIVELEQLLQFARDVEANLNSIELRPEASQNELLEVIERLSKNDELMRRIWENKLVLHNLISFVVQTMQTLYTIPQLLSYESVKANYDLQCDFSSTVRRVLEMIIDILKKNYDEYPYVLK